MHNDRIIKVLKKVSDKLKEENFSFSSIYLFGSFVKNKANKWSDIDMAIVSDKFRIKRENIGLQISKLAKEVDVRIEPHGFTKEEFEDLNDPMVYEIRTTGLKIE